MSTKKDQLLSRNKKLKPNLLVWPIERSAHTFRVHVVEPRSYNPENHSKIFNAALQSLMTSERSLIDPFATVLTDSNVEHFDLVTFPEAFLPKADLLSVLSYLPDFGSFGCVHVGLRPSEADEHLFSTPDLQNLVHSLNDNEHIKKTDLEQFSKWLKLQSTEGKFNIGCLFTIDANQSVRICLHPKLVRSKFEKSPLRDKNMDEADLLSLVTLQPKDKSLLSITIQPLICSDALFSTTDRPNSGPLDAINFRADCFLKPPDHIDIISVATCSPQQDPVAPNGVKHRQWHQEFRKSFERTAAQDASLIRHTFSIFILSNYEELPMGAPGGLSGTFIPIPLHEYIWPQYVKIFPYGRPKSSGDCDNRWAAPHENIGADEWSNSLGYIASLNHHWNKESAPALMLGFTINRLPRHSARQNNTNSLTNFQLRTATYNDGDNTVVFRKEDS